jgi:hypothetical protein
MVQNARALPAV